MDLLRVKKNPTVTVFGVRVTMEMKHQDVNHKGMVTSGRERPCFAISDPITQQRDKG